MGPTGSGKSELAIRLAEEFSGEVLNSDSLQMYRHFDIGTAKVPFADRRGIPHHLIDILDPDELFSAGEYARRGRIALAGIAERGRLPVVAGGTGFYFRALTEGLFAGPPGDQNVRNRLASREHKRPGSLHRILRRLDAQAAGTIHPSDVSKTIRALEVRLLTRRPISEHFQKGRDALHGFTVLRIGLFPPREKLHDRLNRRCESMFASGLVEEAQRILSMGFDRRCKPFESHGYRQALQVIDGALSPVKALYYASRDTRRYAKRQMTWFRRERALEIFSGFGDDPRTLQQVLERAGEFLSAAT